MGVVDLDLEAFIRPAGFLILSMEVDAGVCARLGHNVGLELEVLKVDVFDRPDVEKMAVRAVGDYHTVAGREGSFVLAGLPAIEGLAVK